MVIMLGPPAAGKGFFLGEPPPKYGWKLPQMLVDDQDKPLLTDDDIPDRPAQDESDNHLRAVQFREARSQFEALQKAYEQGEQAFEKVLKDHWYDTKDGDRADLGKLVNYDDFPDDFKDYFDTTNKDFYVSMRGWHDDAKKKNEETGKPKERFKDEARHLFDESVHKKIEQVEDLLIVDSAGEDIDAQDYKGQIETAKAHGYEVTVIFLHPEQADTELSNLARGKVMGKRMVDQSDISNWYEQNAQALKDIQAATPDNFVHYRKGPPDADPEKAEKLRARAREMMLKLKDAQDPDAAKKEINKILYGLSSYKLNTHTSYGYALSGLPDKPEANIAATVAKMNEDAAKRAKEDQEKPTKEKPEGEPQPTQKPRPELEHPKAKPAEEDATMEKTRMNFLRDMGDQKVDNPNPESKQRFPQIKIRSLPWTYQKVYYERWRNKQAAEHVVVRYLEAAMKDWLEDWMQKLADEIESKLHIEGYKVAVEASKGPQVYVTIKGATEDASTARKASHTIGQVMETSIKKHAGGVPGFKHQVKSFNRGADLVLECEVVFP
jgi:hypothetical protein